MSLDVGYVWFDEMEIYKIGLFGFQHCDEVCKLGYWIVHFHVYGLMRSSDRHLALDRRGYIPPGWIPGLVLEAVGVTIWVTGRGGLAFRPGGWDSIRHPIHSTSSLFSLPLPACPLPTAQVSFRTPTEPPLEFDVWDSSRLQCPCALRRELGGDRNDQKH